MVAHIRHFLHLTLPNKGLKFQFMIYRMTANSIYFQIDQQAPYFVTASSQYPLNRGLGVPQNRSVRFVKARISWLLMRAESQFLHRPARNLVIPRAPTTPLLQNKTPLKIINKTSVENCWLSKISPPTY
jgi:hypothetical protein